MGQYAYNYPAAKAIAESGTNYTSSVVAEAVAAGTAYEMPVQAQVAQDATYAMYESATTAHNLPQTLELDDYSVPNHEALNMRLDGHGQYDNFNMVSRQQPENKKAVVHASAM